MISSASLLLALLAGSPAPAADTLPPAPLAARIRAAIAARWDADTASLVLAWGQLPADIARLGNAEVRFPGATDRDGWFAVTLAPASGSPVAIRVRAGQRDVQPVASHDLDAGHLLEAGDITPAEVIRWGAVPTAEAPGIIGWEVRHAVRAGEVLRGGAIAPPVLVRPGDQVTFVWERGAIHMEYRTTALGTARLGESVQGRSGTTRISGVVTAAGVARLEERVP